MPADLVLLLANLLYATSYAATRLTLDGLPPATLAVLRLVVGAAVLAPLAARRPAPPLPARARRRVAAMGVVGFGAAFLLAHWGLQRSTATNAALLIVVEPLTLLALGPALLGERLSRREWTGAAAGLAGATLVIVNGVPGLTVDLVPHWRGDLLLVASGVAYAAYSLLGRPVLSRHPALPVTTRSLAWGLPALLPVAVLEWAGSAPPRPGPAALAGALYLGVAITGLGYLAWNWALERVPAARAALFLNVQPVAGAGLGVLLLGEPLTPFVVAGGLLVVAGLSLALAPAPDRPAAGR